MHMCNYTFICICMCICTCLYICRWLRISVFSNRHSRYVQKYTGLPLYVYVDMYMCMYMFICICMCICTCMYICRWLRTSVLSNRHSPTYKSIRDYLYLTLKFWKRFGNIIKAVCMSLGHSLLEDYSLAF